ncbi:MAG: tetratricopeptide repeat protein [Rhodospirillales bacterium]|nr:tetratricopeptide repeat protein [Rhodospirillales bacterium]
MSEEKPNREELAIRHFNTAAKAHRENDIDLAIEHYGHAISLGMESADLYNNLGVALRSKKRQHAAIGCYHRAIQLKPDNPGAYSNLGNAYRDLARYTQAVRAHRKSVALAKGTPESVYNLGLAIRDFGKVEESITCFDRVLDARPDHGECKWDRAISFLQLGDYEEGFKQYEARWLLARTPPRPMEAPAWDGGDLEDKTLLLYQEQGFGDMLQFVRFVPLIKERFGGKIILECQPPLVRLFQSVNGVDQVIPVGAPLPEHDFATPLLSLPKILGTTLETLPNQVPYIRAPQPHTMRLNTPPDMGLKVGIVWAGKMTPRDRSCPYTQMLDLLDIPGVHFYSLQRDERAGDIDKFGCSALSPNLGDRMGDFADTATIMEQLDLIITIDSAVAHLAGGLGCQVWTLLLYASDWRWLMDRDDSPWYPTMRLFRQQEPNNWDSVFTNVKMALEQLMEEKNQA